MYGRWRSNVSTKSYCTYILFQCAILGKPQCGTTRSGILSTSYDFRVRVCVQAKYLECSCTRDGEKYVCVPPDDVYRCERESSAMKMKVSTVIEIEAQRQAKWEKEVS